MSLDWKSTGSEIQRKIEEAEDGSQEQRNMIVIRNSVVWATLACRFPPGAWAITEENWKVFFERVYIWEHVVGAYMYEPEHGKPLYLRPEHIKDCIGLATNAGNASDKEFQDMIWEKLQMKAQERINAD